jgi:tRNA dimethylallyltransferase
VDLQVKHKLIVISGPTAVGKTRFAIDLAKKLNTEIISSDSRQFYKELSIGTAKPTQDELSEVKHHLINNLSIQDYYNVSMYENDVLTILDKLFKIHKTVIMTGGSGLYIDAVCNGIDEYPNADEDLRKGLMKQWKDKGLDNLLDELKKLDPEFYEQVDRANPKRVIRALEVIKSTGKKYSDQRNYPKKERPFEIVKYCLNRDREELFSRISQRIDQMMENGLLDEVESLLPHREFNALNTVGYKEIFKYLDGEISLDQAITDLKTNTRRYAKRQLTWVKRDENYRMIEPDDITLITNY